MQYVKHTPADVGAYKGSINDNVSTLLLPDSATRSAFALHELLGHAESKTLDHRHQNGNALHFRQRVRLPFVHGVSIDAAGELVEEAAQFK